MAPFPERKDIKSTRLCMEYHEINFGHGELEVTSKYPKGMSNRQLTLTARV